MKTAICYRGHYYREEPHGSNFFLNLDNNKQMVWDCFSDYDIFLHTYSVNQQLDKKLIDLVNPTAYKIENDESTEIRKSILKVNSMMTDEYDFIINLRFDLQFNVSFVDLNIEYNKFNFLWRERKPMWRKKGATSDFLFAYHTKFREKFEDSYGPLYDEMLKKNNSRRDGHLIYNTLKTIVNENEINFLIKEYVQSGKADRTNNKYITLNRNIK